MDKFSHRHDAMPYTTFNPNLNKMDKPIYVKITNSHSDMPFWYNKFLDMGKPAPMFAVIQSPDKPNYWRVVDYTHEIRKSDCEVVPTLQPEQQGLMPNDDGISYVKVIDSGVIFPVDAASKNNYRVPINDYRELSRSACIPVQIQEVGVVPEGQHLISTQQLKELHTNIGTIYDTQAKGNLERWFPTVFVPAKTYKVGDRLVIDKQVFGIAPAGEYHRCILISQDFRSHVDGIFTVQDWDNITELELQNHIQETFTLLPDTTDQMV